MGSAVMRPSISGAPGGTAGAGAAVSRVAQIRRAFCDSSTSDLSQSRRPLHWCTGFGRGWRFVPLAVGERNQFGDVG